MEPVTARTCKEDGCGALHQWFFRFHVEVIIIFVQTLDIIEHDSVGFCLPFFEVYGRRKTSVTPPLKLTKPRRDGGPDAAWVSSVRWVTGFGNHLVL